MVVNYNSKHFKNTEDITIERIRDLYDAGAYTPTKGNKKRVSENFVFDENKSVKWNREEVQRWNSEVEAERIAYNRKVAEAHDDLINDVALYLASTYTHINVKQGKIIADWCYCEYHSAMCDFFASIDSIANLYCSIRNDEV